MNDALQSIAKLHSIDSWKSFNKTWDKEVAVFHIFVFLNYFLPSVLKHQQDKGNVLGWQLLIWVVLGFVCWVSGWNLCTCTFGDGSMRPHILRYRVIAQNSSFAFELWLWKSVYYGYLIFSKAPYEEESDFSTLGPREVSHRLFCTVMRIQLPQLQEVVNLVPRLLLALSLHTHLTYQGAG